MIRHLNYIRRIPLAALGILAAMGIAAAGQEPNKIQDQKSADRPCVVLLHGLGRTHRSMNTMAAALEEVGFKTFNLDYDSREHPIELLAMQVIPQALEKCEVAQCSAIHFVTHSMGGILVRYYLVHHAIHKLGRVIMLSPPNQGSEAADALKQAWYYRWYNGPAGLQLGTGPDGLPAVLGPVNYPVGIITGNSPTIFDEHLSTIIPGEDDGKVSVERAKVQGMSDFLVLPYSHTFIMDHEETIAQTIHFLRHGKFER